MARGNLNIIQQTQPAQLSGGSFATKLVTTDATARIAGHLLKWDAHGNAVDSGSSTGGGSGVGTPILDASGNAIFDSSGEWIFPG